MAISTNKERLEKDAASYHHVMQLLRMTKMKHGTCKPRSRKACTACNAKEELDKLIKEYKGGIVELC